MTMRMRLGAVRRQILSSIHIRSVSVEEQPPVVSFCFDDFPRTAWSNGGRILRDFAVRGTFYAAPGLVNTSNELGDQLTLSDIDAVLSAGHEIGSHTFSHCSCRRISSKAYEADAIKGREALRTMTGRDAESFSYPFGHVSIASKRNVGARMSSARAIFAGVNGPTADLNLLRANSLYGGSDQMASAQALLIENERRRGWLIFYTHDVRPNPSAWGCTPNLLDNTVALALKMGFSVLPVGEVVDQAMRGKRLEPASGPTL